jgi:hypothetical protein
MTNEEIMAIAAQQSYAALYINRTLRLGPGRPHWIAQLARLTLDERQVLEQKLERWEALQMRGQTRLSDANIEHLDNAKPSTWPIKQRVLGILCNIAGQ